MNGILGKATYRPDGQHQKQMTRLENLKKRQIQLPFQEIKLLENYRLNNEVAYFKLCPKTIFDATSPDMIKGMYIPFDYWKEFMNSPHALGERGGKQVNYDNIGRYINNSLFLLLAQQSWIGSKIIETEQLSNYIKDAIARNKSVTLVNNELSPHKNTYY